MRHDDVWARAGHARGRAWPVSLWACPARGSGSNRIQPEQTPGGGRTGALAQHGIAREGADGHRRKPRGIHGARDRIAHTAAIATNAAGFRSCRSHTQRPKVVLTEQVTQLVLAGMRWAVPEIADPHAYALQVSNNGLEPVYRDGDTLLVSPAAPIRRGDRIVARTVRGEVMTRQIARRSARRIELHSLNPADPDRSFALENIAWMHRIVWASQ